jgi:hypothetical protein|tara:strand:- start:354 stop:593 length:240 start_codon:yes stop_codon:yes gene_type:complete
MDIDINRIDVAHEEIIDNCDEFILISCEHTGEDDTYITRANVNTNGEILQELMLDEMNLNKKFATFIQDLTKEYNNQNK